MYDTQRERVIVSEVSGRALFSERRNLAKQKMYFGYISILLLLLALINSASGSRNQAKPPVKPPRLPSSGKSAALINSASSSWNQAKPPVKPPRLPSSGKAPSSRPKKHGKRVAKPGCRSNGTAGYYNCSASNDGSWWTRLGFPKLQKYQSYEATATRESETVEVVCVNLDNDDWRWLFNPGKGKVTVLGQIREFIQVDKYMGVAFDTFLIDEAEYSNFAAGCLPAGPNWVPQPSFPGYIRRFEAPELTVRPGVQDISIPAEAAHEFVLKMAFPKTKREQKELQKRKKQLHKGKNAARQSAQARITAGRQSARPQRVKDTDRSIPWRLRITMPSDKGHSDADVFNTVEPTYTYIACVAYDHSYCNPTEVPSGDLFVIKNSRYRNYLLRGDFEGVTFGTYDIEWKDYVAILKTCNDYCGDKYNMPQPYWHWDRFEIRPTAAQRASGNFYPHEILQGVADVTITNAAAQRHIPSSSWLPRSNKQRPSIVLKSTAKPKRKG